MDETDVLMLAAAHGIDAATVGLYSFYVDCMSTTPPQRKPLTDEEIDEIYMANCYSDTLTFVRAIERAHGITGDNT